MTLLLERLSVRIPVERGEVHAVTEADLIAVPGRPHFVIGGSGSGKSTLCAAITGMLPASARVTGCVKVSGAIGVVPQSAMTCFTPVRRLGKQLAETVRCLRGERGPRELLDLVGLEADALGKYPHELSGGMLQRAAIAAALAGDPAVVVADEPTSALDRERAHAVVSLLTELAASRVVLAATHDIEAVPGEADLSVMFASRIVETGPAAEVLAAPRNPYTRDLLAALPENGLHPLPFPTPDLVDLPGDYRYGS
ncbi:peptide/nickel transport system permease protein [Amycolatopsis xylanica]|uniref:Peptide/nickel transport system permease protein n=1 Tax=Amycolatopsis xylanica TaxID=589385 RepID=A0A1H3CQW8_9PSEU|nr:ATP-binding cassette domain-containing protein [Amycolatopsis xylanica]SDX56515.1 peptide/nickel transport system permease protein [Amycolatopsis xylanica]